MAKNSGNTIPKYLVSPFGKSLMDNNHQFFGLPDTDTIHETDPDSNNHGKLTKI